MRYKIKKYYFILLSIISFCSFPLNAYSINYNSKLNSFSDVKRTDWFYDITDNLIKKNIVLGYPDSKLRPRDFITKAEFVTLLLKSNGYYESVDEDIWYKNYIEKGIQLGIISSNNLSEYNFYIGSYGIAEILCKFLDIKPIDTEVIFSDIETKEVTAKWLNAAFKERLLVGFYNNNSLISTPYRAITRAEAFEIISNLIDYKSNKAEYLDKEDRSLTLLSKIKCNMFSDWRQYIDTKIEYPQEVKEYIDKNFMNESIKGIKIDDCTYTIIISGPLPSSGYNIALKKVIKENNEIILKINYLNPSGGSLSSITYPVAIIKFDSSFNDFKLNYEIEK